MDSRTSESESVSSADAILGTSPGAASTSSQERLNSENSER